MFISFETSDCMVDKIWFIIRFNCVIFIILTCYKGWEQGDRSGIMTEGVIDKNVY